MTGANRKLANPVLQAIRSALGGSLGRISLGTPETVHGKVVQSGSNRPVPSRVSRLGIGGGPPAWIPAPCPEARAFEPGSRFLLGGVEYALPVVRLMVRDRRGAGGSVSFLEWEDLVRDALTVWTFGPTRRGAERLFGLGPGECPPRRIPDFLAARGLPDRVPMAGRAAKAVAVVLEWLLLGARPPVRIAAEKLGIELPETSGLLVKCQERRVWAASAGHMVETLFQDGAKPGACPRRAKNRAGATGRMSFSPGSPDHGIDPYRTPESADIRLQGLLGKGTCVSRRRLVAPGPGPALSLPTGQIPFLGHNDPRRIMVGANYIRQAVDLAAPEPPLARAGGAHAEATAHGVNLRVAYMAWRGLNHEDAWVISEPAAAKLASVRRRCLEFPIRSAEEMPEVLVREGDRVARGTPLIRRLIRGLLVDFSVRGMLDTAGFDFGGALPAGGQPGEYPCVSDTAGEVERVEVVEFSRGGSVPPSPRRCRSMWRGLVSVVVLEKIPLRVGDKLSNRHAAKGIVGAILHEASMPRWNGEPLEALLDPVGVVNRGNWGQIHETIGGASGDPFNAAVASPAQDPSDGGLSRVELPADGSWLGGPVMAVAGRQFVMRMHQNALSKASQSPLGERARRLEIRRRRQVFNYQARYAAWARGLPGYSGTRPTAGFGALSRVLMSAGFSLEASPVEKSATLARLELSGEPPARLPGLDKSLAGGGKRLRLEAVLGSAGEVVAAYPLRQEVEVAFRDGRGRSESLRVGWVPVPPLSDREPSTLNGRKRDHPLTASLKRLLKEDIRGENAKHLAIAVRNVMWCAYAVSVSVRGQLDKSTIYHRRVQRQEVDHSLTGIIAPAGGDWAPQIGLGEIGLPAFLCEALRFEDGGLPERVWITRPPVLHQWGLLSVRPVELDTDEPVIRLHPALIGPLGADFDGDTVYVFRDIPTHPAASLGAIARDAFPEASLWDDVLGEPKFVPGKQYRHGLWMAFGGGDNELRSLLDRCGVGRDWDFERSFNGLMASLSAAPAGELRGLGLPPGRAEPRLADWSTLDRIALRHLAGDPGMGLRLTTADGLAELPLVASGAAKRDQALAAGPFLRGESLEAYPFRRDDAAVNDQVGEIMQDSKLSVPRFGAAINHLINRPRPGWLSREYIRVCQALTERITQQALSVKAGKRPFPRPLFLQLRRSIENLGRGQTGRVSDWGVNDPGTLKALGRLADLILEVIRTGCDPFGRDPATDFLKDPGKLRQIILDHGRIRFDLEDPRFSYWIE